MPLQTFQAPEKWLYRLSEKYYKADELYRLIRNSMLFNKEQVQFESDTFYEAKFTANSNNYRLYHEFDKNHKEIGGEVTGITILEKNNQPLLVCILEESYKSYDTLDYPTQITRDTFLVEEDPLASLLFKRIQYNGGKK